MRRVLLPTAALCLTAPVLTSCGLLGGGAHLDDALDALPSDADQVVFVSPEATAERLDLEDADLDRYVEKTARDAVGGSPLAQYLAVMSEGAAFDERDVVWSVTATLDDGTVTIYRLDDEVDLDALVDDLTDAGLEEDDLLGRRHLQAGLDVLDDGGILGDHYPFQFTDVTIDEDEHLLLVGSGAEAVLETLDGDRDSLTDSDTFDEVLADADDVEFAVLEKDPGCATQRITPEQLEALDLGDLAAPTATAYLVSGDDADLAARLEFDDEDTAEADLEARTDYLENGVLLASRNPFSDYGTAELERDGAVVRVDLDLEEPRTGAQMATTRDGFFACSSVG